MGIPTHYIKKRDLLHSEKSSAATLASTGREFFTQQRYSDALDFFEKAKDAAGIAEIKKVALQHGDTFLLARLDRYDRNMVTREEWDATAAKAEQAGRGSMKAFVERKFAAAAAATPTKPAEIPGAAPLSEV